MAKRLATPFDVPEPGPTASRWERALWALFNSPAAQASGLVNVPIGGVSEAVRRANPGLVKWVMDRSGNIIFGHAGQYHEELLPLAQRAAGGVIENGRVNIFRDLSKGRMRAVDAVREAVARAYVEHGREAFGAGVVATAAQTGQQPATRQQPTAQSPAAVQGPSGATGRGPVSGEPILTPLGAPYQNRVGDDGIATLLKQMGVKPEDVSRRVNTLINSLPQETLGNADAMARYWQQLGFSDRAFLILDWAFTARRDIQQAFRFVDNSERHQQFLKDPKNQQWWDRWWKEGPPDAIEQIIRRGTPEQQAHWTWYQGQAREAMANGTATSLAWNRPWKQAMVEDLKTGAPTMVFPSPAAAVLSRIVAPIAGGLKTALSSLSRPIGRFLMRGTEATADLLGETVQNVIKRVVPQDSKLAAMAKQELAPLITRWREQGRQVAEAFGNARQIAEGWMARNGLKKDDLVVLSKYLSDKNGVQRRWIEAQQEIVDDYKTALAAATTPAQKSAIIRQAVKTLAAGQAKYQAAMVAITPVKIIAELTDPNSTLGRRLDLSPDLDKKLEKARLDLKVITDKLYPQGTPGYSEYYFPEPRTVIDPNTGQVRVWTGFTDFWNNPRVLDTWATTGEEALNNLYRRLAGPRLVEVSQETNAAYRAFVQKITGASHQDVAETLGKALQEVGVKLEAPKLLDAAAGAISPWRDSVLLGRFLPWQISNVMGNSTQVINYFTQNWLQGRMVNPIDFFRGFVAKDAPPYVMETFGRHLADLPVGRNAISAAFGKARQSVYNLGSAIEGTFRSGVWRAEYEQAVKELAARGARPQDIQQLAARVGWDKVEEVMFNYGDRFFGATSARGFFPFLSFKIENSRYWIKMYAEQPWMLRAHLAFLGANHEWKIGDAIESVEKGVREKFGWTAETPVADAFRQYLRDHLGVDDRIIDVTQKWTFTDFLSFAKDYKPAYIQQNEQRLANDLAKGLEAYKNDPAKFEQFLQNRPDVAFYYRYANQALMARLVDHVLQSAGGSILSDVAASQAGVERAMRIRSLFPQQRLLGLLGQKYNLPGLEKLWAEPTDDQISAELRLMVYEKRLSADDMRDPKKLEAARQQAKAAILNRGIYDQALDLAILSGVWNRRGQTELFSALAEDPNFQKFWGVRGQDAAALLKRAPQLFDRYAEMKIDPQWIPILVKRKLTSGIDPTPYGERRQRQSAFEDLPDEVQAALKAPTSEGARGFWGAIDGALQYLRDPAVSEDDKRRFMNSEAPAARALQGLIDSSYDEKELRVIRTVSPLRRDARWTWWQNANADDRSVFRSLYPREAMQYDQQDKDGVPGSTLQPAPVTDTPGAVPAMPTSVQDKNGAVTFSELPARQATVPPMPRVPAPTFDPRTMKPSVEFLQTLRGREGKALAAYRDTGGVWTIGWGHAFGGQGIDKEPGFKEQFEALRAKGYTDDQIEKQGLIRIDDTRAESLHATDVGNHAGYVKQYAAALGVKLTQGQFDALTDLSYNAGPANAQKVLGMMARGDMDGAYAALSITKDAKGNVLPGLVTRSKARQAMFAPERQPGPNAQAPTPAGQQPPTASQTLVATRVPSGQVRTIKQGDRDVVVEYNPAVKEAILQHIKQVNPDLDPKVAARVVDAVWDIYTGRDTTSAPGTQTGFDPMWVFALLQKKSGFDPSAPGGFAGDMQRLATQLGSDFFPVALTADEWADPVKATRAVVAGWYRLQARLGTEEALKAMGLSMKDVGRLGYEMIGTHPVVLTRTTLSSGAWANRATFIADPERAAKFAQGYVSLWWAGGNRDSENFYRQRDKDWSEITKGWEPWQWDLLRDYNPDLYEHVRFAASGGTRWYNGTAVIENGSREYVAWKHKVLTAQSLDDAVEAYKAGNPGLWQQFRQNNGDMSRFIEDKINGVERDYTNWTFTDSQQEPWLEARRKLSVALATKDGATIRKALKNVQSIFSEDEFKGVLRKLKTTDKVFFDALAPYLETPVLTPEMRRRMEEFQVNIDDLLQKGQLAEAKTYWAQESNAGVLSLLQDHNPDWFVKRDRQMQGVAPEGHFIRADETLDFARWRNRLQDAYNAKDSDALDQAWQDPSIPDEYRQEMQVHHRDAYVNYEAAFSNSTREQWFALKQQRVYKPYVDYLNDSDAYGAWSPEKLEIIRNENPGAFGWMIQQPHVMQAITNSIRGKMAGLIVGALRQHNYNPGLLNAIPDDGTRYLVSLSDPTAKQMFERYRIPVTPTQFPRVKDIHEAFGASATVEPETDDNGNTTGRYVIKNVSAPGYRDGTGSITLSWEELTRQTGALNRLNLPTQFFKDAEQMQRYQGIGQVMQLAYQGIQIAQQGGGFFEQLPAYFQAAQAAATAGLFTGPLATLLTASPVGFLAGPILGILGSIFGANRRRQEEEERRRQIEEQQRQQRLDQIGALRERIRGMDRRQLQDVEAQTGAISRFLEQPSAITKQGLLDALQVPRPSW